MPRTTDLIKLRDQKTALLNGIASRQEKIKTLERTIAASEKAHQRQWEREIGHLAWLAGLHRLRQEALVALFAVWGTPQEDTPENS